MLSQKEIDNLKPGDKIYIDTELIEESENTEDVYYDDIGISFEMYQSDSDWFTIDKMCGNTSNGHKTFEIEENSHFGDEYIFCTAWVTKVDKVKPKNIAEKFFE